MEATIGRGAVVALVAVLVLPAMAGVVTAQSAPGTVVVAEGETVGSIDTVTGTIIVRGTVRGDVSGVAGTVHVTETGRVGGSISAAAGDVRVDGEVGGDLSAGSGSVRVTETGRIGGDVNIGTEYLLIDGRVDGDVRVGAERIELGPNAVVGGEFRYDADTFTRDPAATVEGRIVQDRSLRDGGVWGIGLFAVPNWVAVGYGLLANLLLGAILLAVFPRFSSGVATRVADEPVETGGIGLVALIAVPVVLVLVALTIVGIPVAFLGAVGFGFAVWIAAVYGQYAVGSWVLTRAGRGDRWLALVAGLVGFAVVGAIPVLGGLLHLAAVLLGLGALVLGLRQAYRARGRRRRHGRQTTLDEMGGDTSEGSVAED